MIRLIPEANEKLKLLMERENVKAYHKSTCAYYARSDYDPTCVQNFITDMQTLVTKLGLMISAVGHGPQPSRCIESIHYLCSTVLENPSLARTFREIGLNDKGNINKHSISPSPNIYMLRCVTAYNNLVNSIADKYGLRSLKEMIVRKADFDIRRPATHSEARPGTQTQFPSTSRPAAGYTDRNESASNSYADGNLKVTASIEKGLGRYTKGLLRKEPWVNFNLRVSIRNRDNYKITEAIAYVKGKGDTCEYDLSTSADSVEPIDLPLRTYGSTVEITVVVKYKIAFSKYKQIRVSVLGKL